MRKKRETPATLLLFLIYPFLGFILAIRNMKRWTNALVFVLFSALWGYSMTFTFPPSDCYRIAAVFCRRRYRSIQHVIETYDDGKLVDFYLSIQNWFVHNFSDNAKVFFCSLGFVFGLCCMATLRELLLSRKHANSQYLQCIVVLLFCTASFGHLAMPRFWTAAWMSAFVMIKLMNHQYQWSPMLFILPMVHFGFMPVSITLGASIFVFKYFTKHEDLLLGFVILCFIASFALNSEILGHLIPSEWVTGEKATSKYKDYVDAGLTTEHGVVKNRSAYREANRFITKLFQMIMKTASLIVLLIIHNHKEWIRKDADLWYGYIMILLLSSCCYFMGIVNAVGWRYTWFLWMPLYYLLYQIYDRNRTHLLRQVILALIPVNVYTISFMFYVSYRNVDPGLFYMPLYTLIVKGFDFPPVLL